MDGLGGKIIRNTAGGIANAASRSAIDGTDFGDNLIAALPSLIGNTIGNLVAQGVVGGDRSSSGTQRTAERQRDAASEGLRAYAGVLNKMRGLGDGGIDPAALEMPAISGLSPEARISIMEYNGEISSETASILRERVTDIKTRLSIEYEAGLSNGSSYVEISGAGYAIDHGTVSARRAGLTSFFEQNPDHPDRAQAFAALDLNDQLVDRWDRIADAEVNQFMFVSVGAPVLLAGGAALAPVAGAAAVAFGGTSVSGLTGSVAFYGTSFAVGGTTGGVFEYSKNEVFGLPHTPGGYAGSILGGGIGGAWVRGVLGTQIFGREVPAVVNNMVTGGVLGASGDFVGQEIDMKLGYRTNFDERSILVSGGIGAAAGGVVPLEVRVSGLNVGRNNSLSMYNGLQTRITTGNIGQFRLRYGVMGGVGQGVRGVGQGAASSVYVGIYQDAHR